LNFSLPPEAFSGWIATGVKTWFCWNKKKLPGQDT
jgi:hypothetical protein